MYFFLPLILLPFAAVADPSVTTSPLSAPTNSIDGVYTQCDPVSNPSVPTLLVSANIDDFCTKVSDAYKPNAKGELDVPYDKLKFRSWWGTGNMGKDYVKGNCTEAAQRAIKKCQVVIPVAGLGILGTTFHGGLSDMEIVPVGARVVIVTSK